MITKNSALVVVLLLGVGLLTGCGASTEMLTKQVQASIEETWAKDPDLKNVKIKSFMLVHKGGNQYSGVLETAATAGEALSLNLDVTYDGKAFVWKILDGAKSEVEDSADVSEAQKARNIADVEKAKAQLTLPAGVIPGAIGADANTVITSGNGLRSLLSTLKIKDLSELTVNGEKINIGDLRGKTAHY